MNALEEAEQMETFLLTTGMGGGGEVTDRADDISHSPSLKVLLLRQVVTEWEKSLNFGLF